MISYNLRKISYTDKINRIVLYKQNKRLIFIRRTLGNITSCKDTHVPLYSGQTTSMTGKMRALYIIYVYHKKATTDDRCDCRTGQPNGPKLEGLHTPMLLKFQFFAIAMNA